ncbi:trwN protein [Bartonella sp. B12(2025)]
MTVSNFIMLAATCTPATYSTTLSAVIMQGLQGNIDGTSVNDNHKLSHQLSTLKKEIAITKQFEQSEHNFDVFLRQTSVDNLNLFGMSFSDVFDICKNFRVVQPTLTHCYKRAMLKCNSEQTALRTVLNFYDAESFRNGFINASMQKVSSHVGVKAPAFVYEESQKPVQLHKRESEQTIKEEFVSSEELVDAFTHTSSDLRDAFTIEDSSSLEKQQER